MVGVRCRSAKRRPAVWYGGESETPRKKTAVTGEFLLLFPAVFVHITISLHFGNSCSKRYEHRSHSLQEPPGKPLGGLFLHLSCTPLTKPDTDAVQFPHIRESTRCVSISAPQLYKSRIPYVLLIPLVRFHPPNMRDSIGVGMISRAGRLAPAPASPGRPSKRRRGRAGFAVPSRCFGATGRRVP